MKLLGRIHLSKATLSPDKSESLCSLFLFPSLTILSVPPITVLLLPPPLTSTSPSESRGSARPPPFSFSSTSFSLRSQFSPTQATRPRSTASPLGFPFSVNWTTFTPSSSSQLSELSKQWNPFSSSRALSVPSSRRLLPAPFVRSPPRLPHLSAEAPCPTSRLLPAVARLWARLWLSRASAPTSRSRPLPTS